MQQEKDFHEAKCSGKLHDITGEIGTILGPDTAGVYYVVAAYDLLTDTTWLRQATIADFGEAQRHLNTFHKPPRSDTEFRRVKNQQRAVDPQVVTETRMRILTSVVGRIVDQRFKRAGTPLATDQLVFDKFIESERAKLELAEKQAANDDAE